jgi:hypothetical protein
VECDKWLPFFEEQPDRLVEFQLTCNSVSLKIRLIEASPEAKEEGPSKKLISQIQQVKTF